MVIVIAFVFFFFVLFLFWAGGRIMGFCCALHRFYTCTGVIILRVSGVLCSLLVGSGCHGSVSFFLCVWKLWHKLCSCIFVFVSLVCS